MEPSQQAQTLAKELAADIGLSELAFDEDNKIVLLIDGGKVLNILADDQTGGLVLFMRIGTEVAATPETSNIALRANFAWLETRGATLAIEPAGGRLVLQHQLPLHDLDYPRFRSAIERFLETADYWSAIATDSAADQEQPAEETRETINDLAMRLKYQA